MTGHMLAAELIARFKMEYAEAVDSPLRGGASDGLQLRPMLRDLFELERPVPAVFVDRRSPDLVRRLVFGTAEIEGSAETQIEIVRILENVDQVFGIELRACPFECLDQDVGGNIPFKRYVIGRLAGKIFGECILVFED